MKNKILTSVIITVLFAILIVTSSFMILINLEQIKNTKEELKNINYLILNLIMLQILVRMIIKINKIK